MYNQCLSPLTLSANPAQDEVYSIQHYAIKFVSDLRQFGGFLRGLRFPPPIKLKNVVFCSSYNIPTLFRNTKMYTQEVQGTWHSPNTLPTMIHAQAFRII